MSLPTLRSDIIPDILLDGESFVVAVKPAGVLSEDGDGETMPALLAPACGARPLTVHRLDREVGGVMVYAKNQKSAAYLSRQINDGSFIKEYFAIVCGVPDADGGVISDLLFHDRTKNKTYVVARARKGVKPAELEYRCIATRETAEYGKLSLLSVRLHTGRTHQIRAQFAARRLPLLGDVRYGGKKFEKTALFSYRLVFRSPDDGKLADMMFLPRDGGFELFTNEITGFDRMKNNVTDNK